MHWMDMIKVRDLMRTELVTLPTTATIREALETFESERVSGVPVVDATGQPVGVLSAFDVAQSQHLSARGRINDQAGTSEYGFYDEEANEGSEGFDPEGYSPAMLGRETVADWMHSGIIHVEPDATLRQVCELMIGEGIHRVLVLEKGRLVGLLSTMDIVGYLASGAGY